MKAIFIKEFGGPANIQFGELPKPKPGCGEVLVKIKAMALNHLDLWVMKGRPGASAGDGHILGSDASGVIEALGDGVTTVKVGDEVVLNPGVSCMACEFCGRGFHSECASYKLLGFQLPGTGAEYIAVPAVNAQPKPKHLSWEEAAALNLSHITAWRMLFTRAQFKSGESVLLHGIGGGVALAALQMIKSAGGEAIVTSSSDKKLAFAKSQGAAFGINYKNTPDVAAEVKKVTNNRGVDVVIDTVGAPTLPISMNSVRRGGRIVTCGITGGKDGAINIQQLYWNHISYLGSTMGSQEDFRLMLRWCAQTGIKPIVDQVVAFDKYKEAALKMEAGEQTGKLAVKIS